ncbi:hypothetical protein TNCV_680101 [Trichonephila clavipes]|nr:hypothetical protein TNCV_680101 [Trichonephila clavipes]
MNYAEVKNTLRTEHRTDLYQETDACDDFRLQQFPSERFLCAGKERSVLQKEKKIFTKKKMCVIDGLSIMWLSKAMRWLLATDFVIFIRVTRIIPNYSCHSPNFYTRPTVGYCTSTDLTWNSPSTRWVFRETRARADEAPATSSRSGPLG